MSKTRILVVDDDALTCQLLARTLERCGYEPIVSTGGLPALQLIEAERPALIVSDYEMPELNGAELCAWVRSHEHPEIADLPIILLTAHSGEDHEVECLRAGANDFVSKPVNTTILGVRIETHLRLHSLRSQLQRQNDELEEWRRSRELDLEAAQITQRAILPTRLPTIGGWDAASHFQPVIQVGGDMYDWVRLADGGWLFWIADATGHGASAALLTTLAKLVFRHAASECAGSPAALLDQANKEFHSVFRGKSFMTAACLVIRPEEGAICFAGAGHPPLLIHREGGAVEFLLSQGPPIGILADLDFPELEATIEVGDTLLLYTDGLYSIRGGDGVRMTPEDIPLMLPSDGDVAERYLTAVVTALTDRADGPLPDDLAVMALRRTAGIMGCLPHRAHSVLGRIG